VIVQGAGEIHDRGKHLPGAQNVLVLILAPSASKCSLIQRKIMLYCKLLVETVCKHFGVEIL